MQYIYYCQLPRNGTERSQWDNSYRVDVEINKFSKHLSLISSIQLEMCKYLLHQEKQHSITPQSMQDPSNVD